MQWFFMMFPLAFSAGPNNVICAASGAKNGIKGTIPFILGINTIILVYTFTIGWAFGLFFSKLPGYFVYIRFAGAFYIFYLAYTFLRSKAEIEGDKEKEVKFGYYHGLLISGLNPKTIVALGIMYSQFLLPGMDKGNTITILTLLVLVLSICAHFTWTLAGYLVFAKLKTSRMLKMQNKVFAVMLIAVGIWFLWP